MMKNRRERLRMMWALRMSEQRDLGMSTLEGLILLGAVVAGAVLFAAAFRGKLTELISNFNDAS